MPIPWAEIQHRTESFVREWQGETRERAESHSFWDAFFHVFGRRRRDLASFEEPVQGLGGSYNYIDLIWPGTLIVEHKSAGRSLDRAESQAMRYIRALLDEGRDEEVPRYLLVSDFSRFVLHDLESDATGLAFELDALPEHVSSLAFIAGYSTTQLDPEDPANVRAAALLGGLHDQLVGAGYPRDEVARFLVRVLFCLFAEDTGIFEVPGAFLDLIERQTQSSGADLGLHLQHWFRILNTPPDQRQRMQDEVQASLPYVNGELFADDLQFAEFDAEMRTQLIACCRFRWSRISPAVFGSLFQAIMDPPDRRAVGAHYTPESDILKLINSLFLDDLREEFAGCQGGRRELRAFHRKLGQIRLLDPACGCGNFLVVAYRELRRLELQVLLALHPVDRQRLMDVTSELKVSVDQCCGIEIEQWPAKIAQVAMWLVDHQMNAEAAVEFGQPVVRLPLRESAAIHVGNALRMDWSDVIDSAQCTYILGNPPFRGKKERSTAQRRDVELVWDGVRGAGNLDYVSCWYAKAAEYASSTPIRIAFVSTNSIVQGEQVGVMWPALYARGLRFLFAHRSFPWRSEAPGQARVHVVIIGFCLERSRQAVQLTDYDRSGELIGTVSISSMSPYLIEGDESVVRSASRPRFTSRRMSYGSMMIDKPRGSGDEAGLVFSETERTALLHADPRLAGYIRPLVGGSEFLSGDRRYCLWLVDASPDFIHSCTAIHDRLDAIREFRLSSRRQQTVELASTPYLFGEIRQPAGPYLLVPKVSSERRRYIPIGFMDQSVIASGSALVVPDATLYDFAVLQSSMHMAWVRHVGGRLESRYQYSARLIYNNFPWPRAVADQAKARIEEAARGVLDARDAESGATLEAMYASRSMPRDLLRAHAKLDRAVEKAYRPQPFPDDRRRFELLMRLWSSDQLG